MTTAPSAEKLKKGDYKSDQDVRWCPGCGDYGILNAVQAAFAEMGMDRNNTVVVSGIGCSSRFPYYMDTYGFHSIHGRAPAIATGVKLANPELDVWVITGDGDGLSIGGNHFIHAIRRNVGLKILLFNNRIYGLTKGQYSPTSEIGKVTKSTPFGSVDAPFNPISVAIGAGATFVARTVDVLGAHMREVLHAAAEHPGTAVIEIMQNCVIFNDGAFQPVVAKDVRDDRLIGVNDGEPVVYGKEHDKGLIWDSNRLRPVQIGEMDEALGREVTEADLVTWNAKDPNPTLAFGIAQMEEVTEPTAIGVFRSLSEVPAYDHMVSKQIEDARKSRGNRELKDLIYTAGSWQVD